MRPFVALLAPSVLITACAAPHHPAADVPTPTAVTDAAPSSSLPAAWSTDTSAAPSSLPRPKSDPGAVSAIPAVRGVDERLVGEVLAPLDAHHDHDHSAPGRPLDVIAWLAAVATPDPHDREGVAIFVATQWTNVALHADRTTRIDAFVSEQLRAAWPTAVASGSGPGGTAWYPVDSEVGERGDVDVVFARISSAAAAGPVVLLSVTVGMSDQSGAWLATWVGTR